MKKAILYICMFTAMFVLSANVYATTSFNTSRKSLKIYEKYDISEIITTDSSNLKYESSNDDIASITEDGIIFTKKMGNFTITVTDENSSASCEFSSGFYVGIDVSKWNGTIDWKKVKDQGIDFAMIRSSFGWYDEVEDEGKSYDFQFDKQFLNNIKGASENNVSFGIYHYSYATTVEEAELEAEYVLTALNEYGKEYKDNMTLPIAYDIEEQKAANVGKAKLTEIAIAFCTKIYEAGYTPIIYANGNFFKNYLDLDKLNALAYNYWYASPKNNPDFENKITIANTKISPILWQYSWNGNVEGANTSNNVVDMNVLYMKDRVKVEVVDDGQVIDTIGVDKGEKIDSFQEYTKLGYKLEGFKDSDNNTVDENYIFNNDSIITAIFSKIKITGLTSSKKRLEFSTNESANLSINPLPSTAILDGEKIIYSSDDEEIAIVDENGKVTPVNDGICNITCSLESNPEISYIIKVNVHFGYIKGDLDENGLVNANDAAIALDLYKYGNVTENDLKIADLDENGIINANDAALILDIYKYNE